MQQESGRGVLVVEDDGLQLLWLQDVLEADGFTVETAANADRALEVLERNHASIGCVITDVRMPGSLDGIALAQTIRARWPGIHVIMLSAFTWDTRKAPEGARVLSKPVAPDRLGAVVHAECG